MHSDSQPTKPWQQSAKCWRPKELRAVRELRMKRSRRIAGAVIPGPAGFSAPVLLASARDANTELLHARLQRGPLHAEEGRGAVRTRHRPPGFLESRHDF